MSKKLLVVGGNGFLGSAIVKQALSRRWSVVSISRSGKPFITPAGHQPAWSASSDVQWRAADALSPRTYEQTARECDAAISTTGILLESAYKTQQGSSGAGGSPMDVLQGLWKGWTGMRGAPPATDGPSYEMMNRDAALAVARTFSATRPPTATTPSPFIYISAEDIFRPIISARYIETKREAEQALEYLAETEGRLRPVFLRPGLMYHPQTRPLSTLPAAAFDLSSWLHHKHTQSGLPLPTLAQMVNAFPGADLSALARLLTLQPLHVDTVAKAACEALEDVNVRGPVDTDAIQRMAGFRGRERGQGPQSGLGAHSPWPSQQMQRPPSMAKRSFATSAAARSEHKPSGSSPDNDSGSAFSLSLSAIAAVVAVVYGLQSVSQPVMNEVAALSQQERMRIRSITQGVYTWGSNRYNVVAPDAPLTTFIKTPRSIPFFDGMALRDLAMEERYAVAVDANGDVLQWGLGFFDASLEAVNATEQLDDVPLARRREKEKANELTPRGSLGATPMTPVRTLVGKDIVRVATSDTKIFALSKRGEVYVFSSMQQRQWPGKPASWSMNPFKLFGLFREMEIDHERLYATPAAKFARGERIIDIKAGSHHLISLSNKGRTFTTPVDENGNAYGQLGLRRILIGPKKSWREVVMEVQMLMEVQRHEVKHLGQLLPAWALPPGQEHLSETTKPVTSPPNRGIFLREKKVIDEILMTVEGAVAAEDGSTDSRDPRPRANIRFCVAMHEVPMLREFNVAQIAAGADHSIVRTAEGKVFGWGRQTHGQTGVGAQTGLEAMPVPTEIVLSKAFSNANVDIHCTDVTAGADNSFFTMQRREPGRGTYVDLLAVGKGQWGSLGNAMWNQVTIAPGKVKTVSGLTEFSESSKAVHPVPIHKVAIGKPGSVAVVLDTVEQEGHQAFGRDVMVFGHNASYQLGTGKRSNLAVPQHLSPLPPPTEGRGQAAPLASVVLGAGERETAQRLKEADIHSGVLTHMPHKRLQLASRTRADTRAAPVEGEEDERGEVKPGKRKRNVSMEETIVSGAVSMAIYWQVEEK